MNTIFLGKDWKATQISIREDFKKSHAKDSITISALDNSWEDLDAEINTTSLWGDLKQVVVPHFCSWLDKKRPSITKHPLKGTLEKSYKDIALVLTEDTDPADLYPLGGELKQLARMHQHIELKICNEISITEVLDELKRKNYSFTERAETYTRRFLRPYRSSIQIFKENIEHSFTSSQTIDIQDLKPIFIYKEKENPILSIVSAVIKKNWPQAREDLLAARLHGKKSIQKNVDLGIQIHRELFSAFIHMYQCKGSTPDLKKIFPPFLSIPKNSSHQRIRRQHASLWSFSQLERGFAELHKFEATIKGEGASQFNDMYIEKLIHLLSASRLLDLPTWKKPEDWIGELY